MGIINFIIEIGNSKAVQKIVLQAARITIIIPFIGLGKKVSIYLLLQLYYIILSSLLDVRIKININMGVTTPGFSQIDGFAKSQE